MLLQLQLLLLELLLNLLQLATLKVGAKKIEPNIDPRSWSQGLAPLPAASRSSARHWAAVHTCARCLAWEAPPSCPRQAARHDSASGPATALRLFRLPALGCAVDVSDRGVLRRRNGFHGLTRHD